MKHNLEIAYGLKSFIENLFGRRAWLEIKHATDLRTWRKYSIRIIEAVRFSASVNVQISDPQWMEELNHTTEFGIERMKRASSLEELFSSLAATLGQLNFLQMGRIPMNVTHKQVTLRHPGNWKLNQFRSVQYVQSKQQAENLKAHNNKINNGQG